MKKRALKNYDQLDRQYSASRRKFMSRMSLAMAAAGVAQSTRLSFIEELAKKIIPQAHASTLALPNRMIFIGVRSGIPVIPFGAPELFANIPAAITPNVPFAGNQFTKGVNGLHFSPDAMPLMAHQENLLITQGVQTEGGHVQLFNFWQGGMNQRQTSPIITLAHRNPSDSIIPGVHFTQNQNGNRVVQHQTNELPDLLNTRVANFRDNFQKPTLAFDDDAKAKILEASVKLSRRQAFRMQSFLKDPVDYSFQQQRAGELLKTDYREALTTEDMSASLNTGVNGTYRNFGQALALTMKAMSMNLINSSTIELAVGDWHQLRDLTATRPYYQEVSAKLAAAVDYLKATPDIAGPPGTTLWDTTSIVIGSEFNRNDSTFGRDNGDGGAQGTLILSKKVRGGYYGNVAYRNNSGNDGNPRILQHSGVDRLTGQALPAGQTNTTRQLYHTINALFDNPANPSEVITAYLG